MASKRQRKARAKRARQHTTQTHGPATSVEDAGAALAALLSEEQLLAWAADQGLDLRDRDQLLDAAAVGLTVSLWRNTELENQHSGQPLATFADRYAALDAAGAPDEEYQTVELEEQAHLEEYRAELDAPLAALTSVADPGELSRLTRLLEGRAEGHGIPDDVMLRVNVATVLQVRAVLAENLPDELPADPAPVAGTEELQPVPGYVQDLHDLLTDPDRTLRVGAGELTAAGLLAAGWEEYLTDVVSKVGRVLTFHDLLGPRRSVWYLALSGVTYAGGWFPSPHWAGAVDRLRQLVATDPDQASWGDPATTGVPLPDADDEAFWAAVATAPHTLNGNQARWVKLSRLDDLIREERDRARHRYGALPDTERFNPFLALL